MSRVLLLIINKDEVLIVRYASGIVLFELCLVKGRTTSRGSEHCFISFDKSLMQMYIWHISSYLCLVSSFLHP